MKLLQYILGITFGIFLTIACEQVFYRKYDLQESVTSFNSIEINDASRITCARFCLSTEGCTYFYWHSDSCYILNAATPGNSSVNISHIFVNDELKDRCNLDGYMTILGGALCVKIYNTKKNWTGANDTCQQDGGQLLVMGTNVFYIKLYALETIKLAIPYTEYWIGGNDLTTEGEFTWIDGTGVITEGWKPGQPNGNEVANCLQFHDLKFNDNACDVARRFLCEISLK
ncbi:hypothetical protein SNE40_004066 [Patella caerulea]|uniref:C-type lectin domain-containing protein n=1 Tax=Patella caerulea TaxID=87958 RepID=A0AAN8KI39_PATCE